MAVEPDSAVAVEPLKLGRDQSAGVNKGSPTGLVRPRLLGPTSLQSNDDQLSLERAGSAAYESIRSRVRLARTSDAFSATSEFDAPGRAL